MKALVTGASTGIGREMAIYLAELGYDLYVVARSGDKLNNLKDNLKTNVIIYEYDLSIIDNCYLLYEKLKDEQIDIIINNAGFGVYGKFSDKFLEDYQTNLVEVASHNEIKNGKATIRCTIEGTVPKDYDIEIVKTYFNNEKDNKSMFIRVTDKELIEKTGGIIQGMSGSPVIQNGKLVGAITHVFVNDPTKGYAVFADYMIEN